MCEKAYDLLDDILDHLADREKDGWREGWIERRMSVRTSCWMDVLHHLAEGELVFVRRVDVLDELRDHFRVRLRLEHVSTLLLQVRPTTVLQGENILTP